MSESESRIKRMPIWFPGMGSPLESEIRRVEFDADRRVRPDRRG